jgi:hypothetical protein
MATAFGSPAPLRAVGAGGAIDASPATFGFKVVKKKR